MQVHFMCYMLIESKNAYWLVQILNKHNLNCGLNSLECIDKHAGQRFLSKKTTLFSFFGSHHLKDNSKNSFWPSLHELFPNSAIKSLLSNELTSHQTHPKHVYEYVSPMILLPSKYT